MFAVKAGIGNGGKVQRRGYFAVDPVLPTRRGRVVESEKKRKKQRGGGRIG